MPTPQQRSQLRDTLVVPLPRDGSPLGLQIERLRLTGVKPGGPAAAAGGGRLVGRALHRVNGVSVSTQLEVARAISLGEAAGARTLLLEFLPEHCTPPRVNRWRQVPLPPQPGRASADRVAVNAVAALERAEVNLEAERAAGLMLDGTQPNAVRRQLHELALPLGPGETLGFDFMEIVPDDGPTQLVVKRVVQGSPAAAGGIQAGDGIVVCHKTCIEGAADLVSAVEGFRSQGGHGALRMIVAPAVLSAAEVAEEDEDRPPLLSPVHQPGSADWS
eukprot:TRINITY_DN18327_c0_g1_i1.p1 TRINITY_DN18327_c0_g1~~TRINITY_DN18327_c0_g1_i1.p1  ORF type:complete len:275 (+),score=101.25 TRINITY_DN18327_c0_g1_i1:58-882(+)